MLELICGAIFMFGCVPFLVSVFTILKNFITRSETYHPKLYHKLSLSGWCLNKELNLSHRSVSFGWVLFFSLFDVFIGTSLVGLTLTLATSVYTSTILMGTLVTVTVVAVPFLLRFICDVIKGTKLNNK